MKNDIKIDHRQIEYFENGFRICSASDTLKNIYAANDKLGIIKTLYKIESGSTVIFPIYVSRFRKPSHLMFSEQVNRIYPHVYIECFGKGLTAEQCQVSALLEAIERYCSFLTDDDELITGSYNELHCDAIDPFTLCLGPRHYRSYTNDLSIEWRWAYSLLRNKYVLVPALFAFMFYWDPINSDRFFYDSNGLSCGNCMEEAILHGIFEVIERDSLLIMHRNKLCLPDVNPKTSTNEYVQEILDMLERNSVKYYVKIATTDIEVPSFSVFLHNEKNKTYSHTVCSHIDPDIALSRALTEALQRYDKRGESLWLKYCSIKHLHTKSKTGMNMSDIVDVSSKYDLKDNISTIVDILSQHNADVLVVNLSNENIPFPVVRVIIPTLQPADNHENPRFSKRLFEIPKKLGYRKDMPKKEEFMMGPFCGLIDPKKVCTPPEM